jgi:hypothetical protein
VRVDRISSYNGAGVDGKVVDGRRAARPGARVLFINAEWRSQQQTATANGDGEFRAHLGSGDWLVYVLDSGNKPVFARRIEVRTNRPQQLTLVGR